MESKIALNSKESVYTNIRTSIINAQKRICRTVNSAIVQSYWEIGEQIYKECGENERAEYGKEVLKYLSDRLTKEFGKGFSETNLKYMRQFYCAFPNRHTLCDQLTWSHYRLIMRVENPKARELIIERTKAGLKAARARGRMRGRSRKMDASALRIAIATMSDPKSVASEVAKKLNITTATLYSYVNGDDSLKQRGEKLLLNEGET